MDSTAIRVDLFESLLAFHRRSERALASLVALPAHLDTHGAGPEACASAAALLHAFDHECTRCHAEEEYQLWPQLERSIADGLQRSAFRSLRRALGEQHRGIERSWKDLRRPLEAVAEGLPRRLDAVAIACFREIFASHIHGEEAALHRIAAHVAVRRRH